MNDINNDPCEPTKYEGEDVRMTSSNVLIQKPEESSSRKSVTCEKLYPTSADRLECNFPGVN